MISATAQVEALQVTTAPSQLLVNEGQEYVDLRCIVDERLSVLTNHEIEWILLSHEWANSYKETTWFFLFISFSLHIKTAHCCCCCCCWSGFTSCSHKWYRQMHCGFILPYIECQYKLSDIVNECLSQRLIFFFFTFMMEHNLSRTFCHNIKTIHHFLFGIAVYNWCVLASSTVYFSCIQRLFRERL